MIRKCESESYKVHKVIKTGESTGLCRKNEDGSYDMEMVVEFNHQRLFYVGLGISGMTLLACLSYLVYDWRRGKSNKVYMM